MTDLCLACSSSLPPQKLSESKLFLTRCCQQPICPKCVTLNPRLSRYNPCLACLGGVDVIGAHMGGSRLQFTPTNLDGAVRDEDVFIVGDDDEDNEDDTTTMPPPAYTESLSVTNIETALVESNIDKASSTDEISPISGPPKYYIKRTDTLQGIALRFDVDGRELCRLNSLPPSTLFITPHLLHTREFLLLPPSSLPKLKLSDSQPKSSRETERAEKRLQVLTKEVDWRIAKAYVALAGEIDSDSKSKQPAPTVEARAISRYLDDEEWERREGGPAAIQRFPYSDFEAEALRKRSWW
ncbi:uncharacterized protein BT62DRAFT_980348 [Guyanagaster necrorhizus]|uniref:LysM domain-containing protein n=1 Tax=Guyanagaster necrorhizus TaxID=856835 RepID=A0A9P8ATE6_9AGAR|nr:uncharacterized protein BT62DRAFT_980348 [Guyanagaster necrorhizus MCA 3950]KAG7447334.1 hypothetical protein BT62DRAFT_980348 [Guyanagaster necrorhizus MCA 3950]